MTLSYSRTRLSQLLAGAALGVASVFAPGAVQAQGELVVYCSVNEDWCRGAVTTFERETGIKVSMTRKSSGETYAQVKAESANPRGDIMWGGTGDPHLQAAEEGLTVEYKSPNMDQLQDWAVRQWEQSKGRTVGIYSGALGYGFNTELVAKKGIAEPKCWAVQLMGEEKGFDFLKALHKNINQYTKSGAAPAKATGLGETTVGIAFQHDLVAAVVGGGPLKVVAPCEGTGYEIGAMSIIKGARNMDNAKKWYDWSLTAKAQEIGAATKNYQVPSNKNATVPKEAPKLAEIKLIDYDFAKYGSAAERKRLLSKWDNEVKNLPK
jgi:iron(III) transport system substrate-binding protein